MNKDQPGFHKNSSFLKRAAFAINGLHSIWKRESSFRIQACGAVVLLVFCIVVRPPGVWCALFAMAATFILALESINTAVEALLDKLHPQYDPKIGFVKDCLAGAVLLASIGSLLVFALYVVSSL